MSPSLRFSLREHKDYAAYNPDFTFSKPSGSVIRVTTTNTSLGNGFIFIVVPRAWLHGKWIRWYWRGYMSYAAACIFAEIRDGIYDHTSDTDFPYGSPRPDKGAGLLQTLFTKTGTFTWEVRDVQADVDGGTEDYCTLFFWLHDGYSGQNFYLDLDWVEFNEYAGGSGKLFDEQFDASIVMERTGTYGDYGYISEGVVAPYVITGVTRDANGNPLGGCTVWLFETVSKEYRGETISDDEGVYEFMVALSTIDHFIRAHKDGTPNIFGTSERNLKGVSP